MKKYFLFIPLLIYCFGISAQPDTVQRIVPGRRNSKEQQQKPYVILISADGFRYDYAEMYGAKTLLKLSGQGIRADAMIPSYPSVTFPNHYSIATGLYPSHHGLVNNYFYSPLRRQFYSMKKAATVRNGSWYGGTPLWVLAEQQQMLTASFYWIGTEAAIRGIHPTYYYYYNEAIPLDRRIQVVVDWLRLPPERRPHFITFYFSQVDHAGHDYGPDASETGKAVKWVDSAVQKLTDAVKTTGLSVNFIFLGDHGMTRVDNINTLPMPAGVDTSKFFIPRGFELVELYARNKKDISLTYIQIKKQEKNFTVYLKANMPKHLHYGIDDDVKGVIGDILLVPTWPKVFNFSKSKRDPGAHGFDPVLVNDMRTVFYAWGPDFKSNLQVPAFENVHVYPVITKILGLGYTEKIDGRTELAEAIVK